MAKKSKKAKGSSSASASSGITAAGSDAIMSVENAMRQVQNDLAQAKHMNEFLVQKNHELTTTCQEGDEAIKELLATVKERDHSIKSLTERNDELYRSLNAEHSAFSSLKDSNNSNVEKLSMLQNQNLDLINNQMEEKDIRSELTSAVQVLQKEITVLEVEKQKYKEVFKELESKLRVEMESHAVEKEQWKDTNLLFMRKLQTEEQAVRVHKRKAAELAKNVVRLSEENVTFQKKIVEQEQRLQETVAEYTDVKEKLIQRENDYNRLEAEKKEVDESDDRHKVELKKSSEQLRLMAEKVFSLIGQLTKMDEWKVQAVAEQKETQAKVVQMDARNEALVKQLDISQKYKEKMEMTNKQLQDRLLKQRQALLALKQKYLIGEKDTSKLLKQLKGKETALLVLTTKHEHAMKRLAEVEEECGKRAITITQLDQGLEETKEQAVDIKNQVAVLEMTKTRHLDVIKHKDMELKALREKESYYEKVQQTLNNVRNKTRFNEEKDEIAEAEQRQENFRQVLRSKAGQNVVNMLKTLRVPERAIVAWSESPERLIQGLNTLFLRLKQNKVMTNQKESKNSVEKNDKLRGMIGKQKELVSQLQTLEHYKTKALMRLGFVLGNDNEEKRAEAQRDVGLSDQVNILQLSDNGIEDREMVMLSNGLKTNIAVTEVDLRGNRMGNQGLIALVGAALTPSSNLRVLDLQQNHITLDGLVDLANFLLKKSHNNNNKNHKSNNNNNNNNNDDQSTTNGNDNSNINNGTNGSKQKSGDEVMVLAARLRKEKKAMMPILEIRCPSKDVVIDLRYNRLQITQSRLSMKEMMSNITRILQRCRSQDNWIQPGMNENANPNKGSGTGASVVSDQSKDSAAWHDPANNDNNNNTGSSSKNNNDNGFGTDRDGAETMNRLLDPAYQKESRKHLDKILADGGVDSHRSVHSESNSPSLSHTQAQAQSQSKSPLSYTINSKLNPSSSVPNLHNDYMDGERKRKKGGVKSMKKKMGGKNRKMAGSASSANLPTVYAQKKNSKSKRR